MQRTTLFRRLAVAALTAGLWTGTLSAAVTPEQQKQAADIDKALREAGREAVKRNLDEAAALLNQAQADLVQLATGASDPELKRIVDRLMASLKTRRRFLESKGVKLNPLPDTSKPAPVPAGDAVSFTKDVVPIFTANCRGCHINNSRGDFSMASFQALMRGVDGASVIAAGNAKQSRMMELLESGEMPQGNRRLNAMQVALVAKWIDQGAKFDGQDATAAITAGTPMPDQPELKVVAATGNETVKYSRDIAPVLSSQCVECHGGGRPQARLGLDTFQRLLAGTQNGVILVPGKPAESLLIQKLKGTAPDGVRMPARRPPLSTETIAKFEKWIAEGAKYDGPDPTMQTEMVANIYAVSQMSHEQLSAQRVPLAEKNWRLSNPNQKPDQHETDNFLLLGNVGEDRLGEIGQVAEAQQSKVAAILGAPSGEPLVKGRLTIFAFNRRFDYSEYGQMVEKREIPRNWRGHWRYTIVDAYACIYPPQPEDPVSLDALVAEQLAGTYMDSLGQMPSWFTQGAAWVVASRIDRKDPRAAEWDDKVSDALRTMQKADDFLTGKLPPEDAAVANYGFAKYLMGRASNFKKLLTDVKKGVPFDRAFASAYRGTPSQVGGSWAAREVRR